MPNRSVIYALQNVPVATSTTLQYQDMIIDRYNDSGVLWTPTQIAQMGGGAADPRQLFGYVSLGEAEVYRPYWQTSWATNPPSWLGPEDPQWDGNYYVKFWNPEWQNLMRAEIEGVVKQGFDGVYFDVVDMYDRAWAAGANPNAEQDMINLIKSLSDYGNSLDPDFKVYINLSGAESLVYSSTLLEAIDGLIRENLYYTDTGQRQPAGDTDWVQQYLDIALAAGKNVAVTEYVSDPTKVQDVQTQATADGYGYYTSNLQLKGINTSGFSTFPQPSDPPPVDPPPVDPTPDPELQTFTFTNAWAKSGGGGVAVATIEDFNDGDTIDLLAIDADLLQSGDQAFRFIGDDPFTRKGDELRVVQNLDENTTMIFGNIDHDRQAEFKITVKGLHTLSADDFLL